MPVRAKKPEPYLKVVPLVPKYPSGEAVVVETVPGYPDMFKAVLRDGGPLGVAETPHLALMRLASNLREMAEQVEKIAHQKPFVGAKPRELPLISRETIARLSFSNSAGLPGKVLIDGVPKRWVGIGWVAEEDDHDGLLAEMVENDDPRLTNGTRELWDVAAAKRANAPAKPKASKARKHARAKKS